MLQRLCDQTALAVTNAIGTTQAIPFANFAGGMVQNPTGSVITALTWWASYNGVTYLALQDGAGSAITSTVAAAKCVPIPAACFGARFLKAVGTFSAGTSDTIYLSRKS